MSYKSHLHGGGESYSGVVPTKQPNQGRGRPQEAVEGRPLTKENTEKPDSCRTQSRESGPNGSERVREAARTDGKLQSTALLHHVNTDLLRSGYYSRKRRGEGKRETFAIFWVSLTFVGQAPRRAGSLCDG